jgi:NAD(P)-dependent dehydrogenase (short-subunit alcohol dehydrogenase family)
VLAAARGRDNARIAADLRITVDTVRKWRGRFAGRAPDFAARASVILDLYQGFYQGKRLLPGDRILSVDAKPSIQARGRCRPASPAGPGRPMRVEHDAPSASERAGPGMCEAVRSAFGPIDVLVANAGASNAPELWETTEADFDRVIDTNLKSAFFTVMQRRRPAS